MRAQDLWEGAPTIHGEGMTSDALRELTTSVLKQRLVGGAGARAESIMAGLCFRGHCQGQHRATLLAASRALIIFFQNYRLKLNGHWPRDGCWPDGFSVELRP